MPSPLADALASWRLWQPAPNGPPEVVYEIPGGLTNRSWLIQTSLGKGVLRLNSPHQVIWGIDRFRENLIHRAAARAGIAPAVWHCDPVRGFLVTEYIEGEVWADSSVIRETHLPEIYQLVEKIQAMPLVLETFDYWSHLDFYFRTLVKWDVAVPADIADTWQQFSPAIHRFQYSGWPPALVHHDLFSGNIIASATGLKVIDWEYAAAGHPAMELLALSAHHHLWQPILPVISELMTDLWLLLHQHLTAPH